MECFNRITPLFLISLLAVIAFGANANERYEGPIIDVHLHAYNDKSYWGPLPHARTKQLAPKNATEFEAQTVKTLQDNRVVLGVLGSSSVEVSKAWSKKYPGLFLNGVNFGDPRTHLPLKKFSQHVKAGDIEVFAEIGAQYHGLSPSDPIFDPYWGVAEKYGIPVGIHTGEGPTGVVYRSSPKFRLKLGDPLLLEDTLVKFPKLKVYVMHAGGFYYRRMLQLMQMYPQVYAEIGVLGHVPQHRDMETMQNFLRDAKKMGYLDRVMFGSDQMVWPDAITDSINWVQQMDFLTVKEKQMIFYDNAAKFLELEPKIIAEHHNRFKEN